MNLIEEAIIYATIMHQGTLRKDGHTPYILHPLEVAQIISEMTDDYEIIAAGVLHDIVEDTDGSLSEIYSRFGDRVGDLVKSETENKYRGQDPSLTWKRRKEETLVMLKNASDIGIKIMWLGDKLANIRSLAGAYSEQGDEMWKIFNQKDPEMQKWYYTQVAEVLETDLNKTSAFKEFIKHINFIWPGTFDSEKTRYKKYRQYSVKGCRVIGVGAKGSVYRYDDELVIKVYDKTVTYKEIERENLLAKNAFVCGLPTAISFGIVEVDGGYGSMFELIDSISVGAALTAHPEKAQRYAELMADLARKIHSVKAAEFNMELPDFTDEVRNWINGGVAHVDKGLAARIETMVESFSEADTIIHGDFHIGNVMIRNDQLLLIDMDRLSKCDPIVELSGMYMSCIGFRELYVGMVENYMGISYELLNSFYQDFISAYLHTDDESRINEVSKKAALLCYARLVRRIYKNGIDLSPDHIRVRDYFVDKIRTLVKSIAGLKI